MKTAVLRIVTIMAVVLLLALPQARADAIEDAVTKLLDGSADSLVLVEFDLQRVDGRGGQDVSLQGTIVSKDGLVLVSSAKQVDPPLGGNFEKPEKIEVRFPGDRKLEARFVGKDEELNLALLRIEMDEWAGLETPDEGEADSETEGAKEAVALAVAAFDAEGAIRPGQQLLTLRRLPHEDDDLVTFAPLRISAVIPRPGLPTEFRVLGGLGGSQGCPVYTLEGKLVGFVAAGNRRGGRRGGFQVIDGRLVPMSGGGRSGNSTRILHAKEILEFVADPTKYARRDSWLGVKNLQALTKPLAEAYGIEEPGGIIIGAVSAGGPAARAGFEPADVIVAMDGKRLEVAKDKDMASFQRQIRRGKAETLLTFTILRNKTEGLNEIEIQAALEESPLSENEVAEYHDEKFGLKLKPLTRDFLERSRLDVELTGVRVVSVDSASWASIAGIRSGDVVRKMVLKPCDNLDQYKEIMKQLLASKDSEVCYNVLRSRKSLFLCVRPDWDSVVESD